MHSSHPIAFAIGFRTKYQALDRAGKSAGPPGSTLPGRQMPDDELAPSKTFSVLRLIILQNRVQIRLFFNAMPVCIPLDSKQVVDRLHVLAVFRAYRAGHVMRRAHLQRLQSGLSSLVAARKMSTKRPKCLLRCGFEPCGMEPGK